jgi:DUF4097 and DUF4098 domain-containing protein YvlB
VKTSKQLAAFLALIACAALAAIDPQPATDSAAGQSKVYGAGNSWVEETSGSLPAARNLKVSTEAGAVRVEGGSQSGITYVIKKHAYASSEEEARRQFERLRISASSQGDTAIIRGLSPGSPGRGRSVSVDFEVNCPRNIELVSARTGGGGLNVSAIAGRMEGETGGGNIRLNDIAGAISASSGGGSVDVDAAGAKVKVETGGGNIQIHSANGPVEATSGGGSITIDSSKQSIVVETGGGSINIGNDGGDLRASTGGGSINAGDIHGKADLETGGGSISLRSADGPVRAESGGGSLELHKMTHGVQAETGGGGIIAEFIGYGKNFTASRLETAAGDIRVFLPADLPVTVRAEVDVANGHKIHSDFPGLQVVSEGSEWGPKESYCHGSLNGGGPVLSIHTSTGSIDLLKSTLSAAERNPQ